jgi:glycosyltransferase involved in cell wall biosynthesis
MGCGADQIEDWRLMESQLVSIVVPVFDEESSLEQLVREIDAMSREQSLQVQVVFVDDGSRDGSWAKIAELAEQRAWIGGVRFRKNEGKAAALMAGFAAAQGEYIVTMDADLQDPPGEVPDLLAKIDVGFDVVSGWKRVRHDPWHKVFASWVFNWLTGRLTGVRLHDHVCGLKCYRRAAAKDAKIYGELHRFLCVLAAADGYRVGEVATLHRPRTTGVGKYGFSRFAKGLIDLLTICCLTRYRRRPQHVFGVVGLYVFLATLLLWLPPICLLHWPLKQPEVWPISMLLYWLALGVGLGMVLVAIGLATAMLKDDRVAKDQYKIVERVGWCAGVERGEPTELMA